MKTDGGKVFQSLAIRELEERIEALEKKVFRGREEAPLTKSQKLLILDHLGVIGQLQHKGYSNKQIGELLNLLCDINAENTRKDLSELHTKESPIKSEGNYKAVIKALENCGLKDLASELDISL